MHTKRISAYFATVGLAAGGFLAVAAAPAASAGTGPVIATKAQAGYQASGRNFRFVAGTITVPDTSFLTGFYPSEYLQLSNGTQLSTAPVTGSGDQYIRAGIVSCTVAARYGTACSGWAAFVTTFTNSLGSGATAHFVPLSVSQGDGVFFSVYYDAAGQDVHVVINPPDSTGSVPSYTYEESVPGALFDHAGVIDDFTDATGTPVGLPSFVHAFRISQFLGVSLTTYSGARGSLAGPWTTSEVEATSNGLPYPSGNVRVSPNALWSDGMTSNGAARSDDAAGIWAR